MSPTAAARKARIVCLALGTRGDVQPVCLLARDLMRRGHSVTFITSRDYLPLALSLGVRASIVDVDFESTIRFHKFNDVYYDEKGSLWRKINVIKDVARDIEGKFYDLLMYSFRMLRYFDLVIYNPFAFFAGQIAEELNIPAVRVSCQPLLPTRSMELSAFGGRNRGAVLNRLSYETLRVLAFLFQRSLRKFRASFGVGRRFRAWMNPLNADLRFATQILAYSPHLSPDPGDYPVPTTTTGYWFHEAEADETLPDDIMAFLEGGDPALYIGFGSMFWGAQRNTEVVLKALALWGGRAIVATGTGSLKPMTASPNVMIVPSAKHALLFPHVAGAVHHGGAGTTAQALRCGLPSVILPVLGDQFYWGRRVAAVGAGPEPVPLRRIEPEALARMMADLTSHAPYREAARHLAAVLADEPGLPAAVARIELCLAETAGRWQIRPRAQPGLGAADLRQAE